MGSCRAPLPSSMSLNSLENELFEPRKECLRGTIPQLESTPALTSFLHAIWLQNAPFPPSFSILCLRRPAAEAEVDLC